MRNPTPVSRFFPRRLTASFWAKAAALLALPIAVFLITQHIDIGEIFRPDRLTRWLSQAGPSAPFLFMGLMALAVIISPIPSLPLDIAARGGSGRFLVPPVRCWERNWEPLSAFSLDAPWDGKC